MPLSSARKRAILGLRPSPHEPKANTKSAGRSPSKAAKRGEVSKANGGLVRSCERKNRRFFLFLLFLLVSRAEFAFKIIGLQS